MDTKQIHRICKGKSNKLIVYQISKTYVKVSNTLIGDDVTKKHVVIIGKAIGFFALWVVTIVPMSNPIIEFPSFIRHNAAFLRLWWELLPLVGVLVATAVFQLLFEKKALKVSMSVYLVKNTIIGLFFGFVWIGMVVSILSLVGIFSIENKNDVTCLPIWFIAVFINVIMQNMLVRGYLFSLFKESYNTAIAVISTTILFTILHGEAFKASTIAVLNVITMSLFVSLLLVFTGNLIAPIMAHFLWNSIGGLVYGVVSLADDYPDILNCNLTGSNIITGGDYKIEGSIVVFAVNLSLIVYLSIVFKRRSLMTYCIIC